MEPEAAPGGVNENAAPETDRHVEVPVSGDVEMAEAVERDDGAPAEGVAEPAGENSGAEYLDDEDEEEYDEEEEEAEEPDNPNLLDLRRMTYEQLMAAAAMTHELDLNATMLLNPDDDVAEEEEAPQTNGNRPPASIRTRTPAASNRGRSLREVMAAGLEPPAKAQFYDELVAFLGRDTEARVPLFRAEEVDLFALFRVVASRGGFLKAAGNRAWSWVAETIYGKISTANKHVAMRQAYEKLLYAFERDLTFKKAYAAREAQKEFPGEPGVSSRQERSRPERPARPDRLRRGQGGGKKVADTDDGNFDWCDVCRKTGELLCCDTCPKAFHVHCAGLVTAPEDAKWKCPSCLEDDPNCDWCAVCNEEGDLVCCDFCPRAYHKECLDMGDTPDDDKWKCPHCVAMETHGGGAGGEARGGGEELAEDEEEEEEDEEKARGEREVVRELAAATVAATNAPTAEEMRVAYGPAAARRVGVRGQCKTAAGRTEVAKAKNRAKKDLDELLGSADDDDELEEAEEEDVHTVVESVKKPEPRRSGRKGRWGAPAAAAAPAEDDDG